MARPRKTAVEKKAQTTAAPAKPAVSAAAEEKKTEAEVTEAKAEEVKAEKPAEPAAKKEEKPAKKAPAKRQAKKAPVENVEEVYVEYNHEQFMTGDIVNRIKETYKGEGHRISSIKSLKVYVDPVQRKAYYVINEKAEGKSIDL